jgi:type III pantothenate kinase
MIFLADIGNTTINCGLAEKQKIKKTAKLETKKKESVSFYTNKLKNYFKDSKIDKDSLKEAVFCSVVPSLNSVFKKALRDLCSVNILEAGKDLKFSVKNRYRKPEQVGADRLVNAEAALDYYKKTNVIIIDFGTALTFDVVNKKGQYLGGLIAPGIKTTLKSLSEDAELLPEVNLKRSHSFIGKDTATSINNGLIYTISFACSGIVKRLKKEVGPPVKVIATGGYSDLIKKHTDVIDKIRPNFTLEGLWVLYNKNK